MKTRVVITEAQWAALPMDDIEGFIVGEFSDVQEVLTVAAEHLGVLSAELWEALGNMHLLDTTDADHSDFVLRLDVDDELSLMTGHLDVEPFTEENGATGLPAFRYVLEQLLEFRDGVLDRLDDYVRAHPAT